jgi:hypothetical protein
MRWRFERCVAVKRAQRPLSPRGSGRDVIPAARSPVATRPREEGLQVVGDRAVEQALHRLPPAVDDLLDLPRREHGRG